MNTVNDFQESLATAIADERRALLQHRLYGGLRTMEHLAVFMEHHVFAVWDFMSLLKALQMRLTCASVPWLPQGNTQLRRMVNEIVLGEESDALPAGGAASHFELYLQAMREAGADTAQVEHFIRQLEYGQTVGAALEQAGVPTAVSAFVQHTFAVIQRGRAHEIAAAFAYGREDLIPEMFTQLVHGLERQFPGKLAKLRYYLDRHIELDGDEHGEMGRQMVTLLCRGDSFRENEATQAAVEALQSRILLWDGIAMAVEESEEPPLLWRA
jgi:pyrroloquinoline quinone (PQQ) biosynthesis protein C